MDLITIYKSKSNVVLLKYEEDHLYDLELSKKDCFKKAIVRNNNNLMDFNLTDVPYGKYQAQLFDNGIVRREFILEVI